MTLTHLMHSVLRQDKVKDVVSYFWVAIELKPRSQLKVEKAAFQPRLLGDKMQRRNGWSERRRMEEALKASEVRYRRLFETAKEGILILDAETGHITDANPFLQNLLGYSRTELFGKSLWENDVFGHGAGDALLRELGCILRNNLRMSDIACRHGGDEFMLILPDLSLADTRKRVQQILALVKELRIRQGEQQLSMMTLSAGVAAAGKHDFNRHEILRAADEALYSAKQAGRDCVMTNPAVE